MQDLNDKITGNTLTAAEWNEVPSEIQNVIEALGITLSSGDLNQLGKAIAGYVANGTFYTDSGIANVYTLTKVGLKQTASAYTDGFFASFIAGNINTAASTVNVAGLGLKSIVLPGGTALAAGDISGRTELAFDSANDRFELLNASIDRLNPDTLAIWQADTSAKVKDVVTTKERLAGKGGGGTGDVISGTGTANGTNIVAHGTLSLSWVLRAGSVANVKQFGADNIDDTVAFRGAAAYLGLIGGGVFLIPDSIATYKLSTADALPWCVQIPKNVTVRGESWGAIVELKNFEEVSLLFVNVGADTATVYNADGNITFENFTLRMTDGTERLATNGDLIGFGHGERLIVQNMNFGQHTNHCLDIGGSRNVKFINNFCFNTNGLTGFAANADVQVDSANAAAFLGLNVDGTESEEVLIQGNHMESLHTNEVVHIGHNGGTAKNVTVINNYIAGADRAFAKLIKCDADDASLDSLIIANNLLETFAQNNQAHISIITNGNNSETIKNVNILGNTLKGFGRIGIDVGLTDSFLGSTVGQVEKVIVDNNNIDIDCTGATILNVGIQANLMKLSSVKNNNVKVLKDTDSTIEVFGIRSITADGMMIKGNEVEVDITTFTGTQDTACIKVDRFGSVATTTNVDIAVVDNTLDVTKPKFGIHQEFALNTNLFLFSRNRFRGDLVNGDAHIFESIPSSDGTNGYRSIDLTGAGNFTRSVALDTEVSISTGLIKKSKSNFIRSKEVIDVNYTSGGLANLSTDTEDFTNNTVDIAFQIRKINPGAGTFSIITGDIAVSVGFVAGAANSNRAAGTISVMAGI